MGGWKWTSLSMCMLWTEEERCLFRCQEWSREEGIDRKPEAMRCSLLLGALCDRAILCASQSPESCAVVVVGTAYIETRMPIARFTGSKVLTATVTVPPVAMRADWFTECQLPTHALEIETAPVSISGRKIREEGLFPKSGCLQLPEERHNLGVETLKRLSLQKLSFERFGSFPDKLS